MLRDGYITIPGYRECQQDMDKNTVGIKQGAVWQIFNQELKAEDIYCIFPISSTCFQFFFKLFPIQLHFIFFRLIFYLLPPWYNLWTSYFLGKFMYNNDAVFPWYNYFTFSISLVQLFSSLDIKLKICQKLNSKRKRLGLFCFFCRSHFSQ